jgi:RND family efflux transporter MFP subunit
LTVDLADSVERGQVVAELDAAEFIQAVQQAEAELAVEQAMLRQAENAFEISGRENERIRLLRERGIASDAEFDIAQADLLQKQGQVQVAQAQVRRAEAALETARIRHSYTQVTADWSEEDSLRRVAERHVDEGQMVTANQALFLVVQMDPIVAVITVTERDYGQLRPDLEARLQTDALPGETFEGRVVRVSPVFQTSSRQARVEIELPNPDNRLKPGMFVRATLTFRRVAEAWAVPEEALTRRRDREGLFVLDAAGTRVRWVPVTPGIRSGGWVELLDAGVTGRVVTLGQHLIDDGSAVVMAEPLLSRPTL